MQLQHYHQTANSKGAENIVSGLNLVESYFDFAQLPGNSIFYDYAESILLPLIKKLKLQPELISAQQVERLNLSYANLLQQKHQFDSALNWLAKISKSSPSYPQSQLIYSRIKLIQGEPEAALNACKELIGISQLSFAHICMLEAKLIKGEVTQSYQGLVKIKQQSTNWNINTQRWVHTLLGDASALLNKSQQSQDYYAFELGSAPVSQWLLWTNQAEANQDFINIYNKLENLAESKPQLEDSLLLRLARAEKYTKNNAVFWQNKITQKMLLREKRKDKDHAADLAYFYIYLNPNPVKALMWAELNWASAKEPMDKQLLDIAQMIQGAASNG
ncbi:hypothetical protein ACUR5C_13265 [Aliikangiella sp. IMCC44653]